MEERKKLKDLLREVGNLIVKFVKPYGCKDEILAIPKHVKRIGFKVGGMSAFMTIVSLVFAFMLKGTNVLIQEKFILLGIILFMLYRGQEVVRESFHIFESSENEKFNQIFQDEIVFRGSMLIAETTNKVQKYDEKRNLYQVMSDRKVLNSIKNYMSNLWRLKINHIFEIVEIISVMAMLIVAMATNTAIPNRIFIPMIIGFVIITFFSSAYVSLNRKDFYVKNKECDDEQAEVMADLMDVPKIVRQDTEMRIGKLKKSIEESNKNTLKFYFKLNVSRLITTIVEAFSQYGIIILFLMEVEWNNITLATITELSATLLIVETALGRISDIMHTLNGHNEKMTAIEKEQENMELILNVFHSEQQRKTAPKRIQSITIDPFAIQYVEESENDKPFTLVSDNQIQIEKGQVVILYGPSGSGKSTMMKMLTERIRLKKSTEVPSTSRYMFFDETLKFGSLSLFEELFCSSENPNLDKMQTILKNLHLWEEISANCFNVWQWMKEKHFKNSLSNGQKQRLILAKMLYWMDEEIDVVVLDECTSGLDDKTESEVSADAEKILEYVVRYCNSDKKRIVVISTHQNIDGFKANLMSDHMFRNLYFTRNGERSIVKEINQ